MSLRTLPITAVYLYEKNSAYISSTQALSRRLKLLPANLKGKKADFSLGRARLLDIGSSMLLIIAFYISLSLTIIL